MAKNKTLFYGRINVSSTDNFHRNGTNGFIRVRFDCTTSSTTLTNVTDQGGSYFGQDKILVGQQLVATTQFPSGTTITAVDTSANTITVEDNPAADGTNRLARISPSVGSYFVESGSLVRPSSGYGVSDYDLRYDLTGSHDTEFDEDDKKAVIIIGQAITGSLSTQIDGDFAAYEVTRVTDRINSSEANFYISASSGIYGEEANKTPWNWNNAIFYEVSLSSSLPPLVDGATLTSFPGGGYEYAGYNLALQEYYDDLRVGIYSASVLVEGNADFINFTGSAVKSIITESINGQTGVLVELEGGSGDTFPYTGSAEITGSLGITGSFQIESGSTKPLTVNADGIVQLFAHENDYNPTAVLGGIYFTSQSVYLGLEE